MTRPVIGAGTCLGVGGAHQGFTRFGGRGRFAKMGGMTFSADEVAYLRAHGTGRLATVDGHGQPDAVPVAVEFDGTYFWVGGGATVTRTRKFRNVAAGNDKVCLVVDDVPSFDPFVARGVRVYGRAEQPFERVGMVGPGTFLRITPTVSWSWNLAGEPVGDRWYASTRTVHTPRSAT